MKIKLFALSILSLLLSACVSTTSQLYRGDMELVTVSGDSCVEFEKENTHIQLELILKQYKSNNGQQITGYLSGPDIQTGKLSGSDVTQLQVAYPDESDSIVQGHSLLLAPTPDGGINGELHEKPVGSSGCYFVNAAIRLKHAANESEAAVAFDRQQKLFVADTLFLKGQIQLKANNPEEALRNFSESQRVRNEEYPLEVSSSYRAFSIATAHMMAGRSGYALKTFRNLLNEKQIAEAATRQRHFDVIRSLCAYTFEAKDDVRKIATEQLLDGLAHDSNGPGEDGAVFAECYLELGQNRIDQDEPDEAIEYFQKALNLNPNDTDSIGGIVMSNVVKGNPTEGRTFLQKHSQVMIDKTGSENYNSGLLRLYATEAKQAEREHDYMRAELLLREALKISPNERLLVIDLATVLEKIEKRDEAQKLLETASSNCSDEPCRRDYASALARQKQIEKIVDRLGTER